MIFAREYCVIDLFTCKKSGACLMELEIGHVVSKYEDGRINFVMFVANESAIYVRGSGWVKSVQLQLMSKRA